MRRDWRAIVFCWALLMTMTGFPILSARVAGQNKDQVTVYINNADRLMNSGNYKAAIEEYNKALKLDSNNNYAAQQKRTCEKKLAQNKPGQAGPAESGRSSFGSGSSQQPSYSEYRYTREYSRVSTALDSPAINARHGFSIRPPAGWWVDTGSPHYAMKIVEPNYEAFIFVDVLYFETEVVVDQEFQKFIEKKNETVSRYNHTYKVEDYRFTNFKGRSAIETRATFTAGATTVLMNTYYFSSGRRLYMITTVCDQKLKKTWNPVFQESVLTFTFTGE